MAPHASAEQRAVVRAVLTVGELRLDLVLPLALAVADLRHELAELAERAGARISGREVLHDASGRLLPPSLPLTEAGVPEGAVLVLREPEAPAHEAPQHLVPDAVGLWVAGEGRAAGAPLRASVAVVFAGIAAVLCVVVAALGAEAGSAGSMSAGPLSAGQLSAGPVWPGLLSGLVAVGAAGCAVRTLRRDDQTSSELRAAGTPQWWSAVAGGVLLAAVAGVGHGAEAAWGAPPGNGGASIALVALALLLACLGVLLPGQAAVVARARPWLWVPLVLALVVGAAPRWLAQTLDERWGVVVHATALSSGAVVVLVLTAGVLGTLVTDWVVVRPARGEGVPVRPAGPLARRLEEVRCTVLALDLVTVLAAVVVTPAVVTSGGAGAGLWAALVLALVLRVRGERWWERVLLSGGGAVLVLLVGAGAVVQGSIAGAGPAAGVMAVSAPVLGLVALVAAVAATRGGAAALARPGVALDRTVRVLLPSLWLLSSGLVPGWSA